MNRRFSSLGLIPLSAWVANSYDVASPKKTALAGGRVPNAKQIGDW